MKYSVVQDAFPVMLLNRGFLGYTRNPISLPSFLCRARPRTGYGVTQKLCPVTNLGQLLMLSLTHIIPPLRANFDSKLHEGLSTAWGI